MKEMKIDWDINVLIKYVFTQIFLNIFHNLHIQIGIDGFFYKL